MRTFGLIGYPLSHSFSQKYFTEKFERENISDCKFVNFPVGDLRQEIVNSIVDSNPTLQGLSVTIPHKENIITLVDAVNQIILEEVCAVNCIHIRDDLNFKGDKAVTGTYRYTIGY